MDRYEYVRFDRNFAYDFRGVILPDVMDQLLQCENYEEQSLVCAGVVAGEIPVGAAVAQILTGGEVYLHSLYVAPEHRRKHLASELLDRVLTSARKVYHSLHVFADTSVQVFLHTGYVMQKEASANFTAFLKAYGFREFQEREPCYLFTSGELKESDTLGDAFSENFMPCPTLCRLSTMAGEAVSTAARYLDFFAIDIDPKNLFVLRRNEEAQACMFAEIGGENEFSLGFTSEKPMDTDGYLALLKALLQELNRAAPEFLLIVSTDRSGAPTLWTQEARLRGKAFSRTEAAMYISLE